MSSHHNIPSDAELRRLAQEEHDADLRLAGEPPRSAKTNSAKSRAPGALGFVLGRLAAQPEPEASPNCLEDSEIVAYLHRTASPAARQRVDKEIANCQSCATRFASIYRDVGALEPTKGWLRGDQVGIWDRLVLGLRRPGFAFLLLVVAFGAFATFAWNSRKTKTLAFVPGEDFVASPTEELQGVGVEAGISPIKLIGPDNTSIATLRPRLEWAGGESPYVVVLTKYVRPGTSGPAPRRYLWTIQGDHHKQIEGDVIEKGAVYVWTVGPESDDPATWKSGKFYVLKPGKFETAASALADPRRSALSRAKDAAKAGLLDEAERLLSRAEISEDERRVDEVRIQLARKLNAK
jgi:hypothetical protein